MQSQRIISMSSEPGVAVRGVFVLPHAVQIIFDFAMEFSKVLARIGILCVESFRVNVC